MYGMCKCDATHVKHLTAILSDTKTYGAHLSVLGIRKKCFYKVTRTQLKQCHGDINYLLYAW